MSQKGKKNELPITEWEGRLCEDESIEDPSTLVRLIIGTVSLKPQTVQTPDSLLLFLLSNYVFCFNFQMKKSSSYDELSEKKVS